VNGRILDGRVALVTGAASGIGLAIARRLAKDGARVVIADVNEVGAVAAASELARTGDVTSVILDVRSVEGIKAAVARILELSGQVDILVNNAGKVDNTTFLETSPEVYDATLDVNLRGTFFLSQTVAKAMVGRGGSIVNIASVAAQFGCERRPVYGPAKAAIMALTQAMAVELARYGIRVNAIAPGTVETPLVAAAHSAAWRKLMMSRTPAARYAAPEEIAAAVAFLVSDDASYVMGHTLNVDGGFAVTGPLDNTGAGL